MNLNVIHPQGRCMKVTDGPLNSPQLEVAARGHLGFYHPARLGSHPDPLQILHTNTHAAISGTKFRKTVELRFGISSGNLFQLHACMHII